jgi:hypothetical protein
MSGENPVAASDGDQFAVGINAAGGAHVRVDASCLLVVEGRSRGADFHQSQHAIGTDETGVDMFA